jgi:curved DNA-binding protein CbpA
LACEGASHYEVLGVDEKTDSTTIQATFLNLAKKWHPDRLPANARSLRADATKLFSRFSEAHQVLSSATQRAEYDRRRSETQGEPGGEEDVQRVLKAASAFQKAEAVAKRGDWAQVEHLAKLAQELDPSQPDYSALHAWAIAKSGQRVANNNYDDLLAILSVAVKALKNNAKVRLYRAQVLKAAGQTAEALKDYRAVVELEPNNVEAARELRLHKMRAAEQTNNPDGLLKRFFKK